MKRPCLLVAACFAARALSADADDTERERALGTVTVIGSRPTSLPTEIPTTIEGVDARTVERTINATDSEDALKYLPSLLVRKRYAGDYDHAVLGTRASGTNNSARSLIYADGILLSNLLGNGATFTPRWGLVTPEELERVDVLYGPFSAAYPGNSVGAVVDYVTRMPERFEARARISAYGQDFGVYGTRDRYLGWQTSASVGDRNGDLAWWANLSRMDSDGQPLTFATRLIASGSPGNGGTPVSGAVTGADPRNQPWLILGSGTQYHTVQDHLKLKFAYDFTERLRLSYTFGAWRNDVDREAESYLRDTAGRIVYTGAINVAGRQYTVSPADFTAGTFDLLHVMHGVSLKSRRGDTWDYELSASQYDYAHDRARAPTGALPAAEAGGVGRITDQVGTGWNTLAARGTWRPGGMEGAHIVEIGLQRDAFRLRTTVYDAADWRQGDPTARFSAFRGDTELTSLYLQDAWRLSAAWLATLGARLEHWRAHDGSVANAQKLLPFAERDIDALSPKAALAFQADEDWVLKASIGRAVRMPTVAELYQGSISVDTIVNNDPNLAPERSWTGEITAERALSGGGRWRNTLFAEDTQGALYSQTNVTVTPNITNIQNVDHIRTWGAEVAWQRDDVGFAGLDLAASATYAHSRVLADAAFPVSVGRWQPRVPQWRMNAVASWRATPTWTATLAGRYSGRQYNSLDNGDTNAFAYTGTSSFLVLDARVRGEFAGGWSASAGIDNLNNETYWAFHPYTQRTATVEVEVRW